MRPRLVAAENPRDEARSALARLRFNEAAARRRGKPDHYAQQTLITFVLQ